MTFTITVHLDHIAVPTGYVIFDVDPATNGVKVAIQANRNAPDEVLAHEIHHAIKLARMFTGGEKVGMDTFHLLEREANAWAETLNAS
ncbi:hypothetical protein SAMN02745206_03593 [Desulfacinum infernum DSM 9756]|jgi:hypothetical protein|uniref:Uncharacterized protein n=1 Tax=Desulfacinum infernum DSM 9756 TaxID=1121391 RepID=A0A1M5IHX5_9BACT|nr:hypothetical protein [Desulfacinum infernum]SHG27383.1 hypothetical protein SAMN02745206_03593 [Desulfacinum infernum DSM 9756]